MKILNAESIESRGRGYSQFDNSRLAHLEMLGGGIAYAIRSSSVYATKIILLIEDNEADERI